MNGMRTLEESVVASMDGTESELFPFLPYILQDLWEFGAQLLSLFENIQIIIPISKYLIWAVGKVPSL